MNKQYSLADKQILLELSAEVAQFLFLKEKITEQHYKNVFLNTLSARSKLESKQDKLEVPKPASPDRGHKSDRIEIATGSLNNNNYLEISYRPAYHDITNRDDGYVENSQVVFMDTSFRYFSNFNSLKLQKIDAIDIISITPMDFFDYNFSWKAKTGFDRKPLSESGDIIFYYLNVSAGSSYMSSLNTFYFFGNAKVNYSGEFSKNASIGAGLNAGIVSKMIKNGKSVIDIENNNFFIGHNHHNIRLSANQSFFIEENVQLGIKFTREKYLRFYSSDIKIYIDYFF